MPRRWPYLVPVLYLAAVLWVQPADRLVMPWTAETLGYPLPPSLSRWLTDDCDTLAYAVRAENAARGRLGGLTDPATHKPYEPGAEADRPAAPLLDRYFLEYPPAALALFRLGHVGSCREPAPAVPAKYLDCHQAYVGTYDPVTDDERRLVRSYRHAVRVYAVLMTAALLALMALVDARFGPGPLWMLVLPGFLYFTVCRFDVLPAGLVLASTIAGDRRRVWLAGLCLGMAVALKTYPLALAPLLLRFSARNWAEAVAWCAGAALPVVLSYGAMYLTDGTDGVLVPFLFQLQRPLEPHWCFFGRIFPAELADKTTAASLGRVLPVLVPALLLAAVRPRDLESLLRRAAVIVILFISFQTFFSPQWGQWLAVLLVPLAVRHPWLAGVVAFHDLWGYLYFPVLFDLGVLADGPWEGLGWTAGVHTWTRALLYAGLAAALLWQERAAPKPRP